MLNVKKTLTKMLTEYKKFLDAQETKAVGTDIIDLASGLSFNRYDCRIKDGFLILNCFIYKNGSNFTTPRETIGTLRKGYRPALYISTICTGSNGQNLHANRSAGVIINTAGGVLVDPHSTDMKQIYLYVMFPIQNTGGGIKSHKWFPTLFNRKEAVVC